MFFCEFCEIFKNNYFVEHLQTTASLNTWELFPIILNIKFMGKVYEWELNQP